MRRPRVVDESLPSHIAATESLPPVTEVERRTVVPELKSIAEKVAESVDAAAAATESNGRPRALGDPKRRPEVPGVAAEKPSQPSAAGIPGHAWLSVLVDLDLLTKLGEKDRARRPNLELTARNAAPAPGAEEEIKRWKDRAEKAEAELEALKSKVSALLG